MRLLFTTAIMTALIAPAYAGSGGKNAFEERVYLNDLQEIKEPAVQEVVRPLAQQPASLTSTSPVYKQVPASASSESLSYFANKNKANRLKPRVELNHRYSNDRAITMSEFWVPLAQNEADGSVLFGDVRLMGDNNSNREFNVGAGYRKIVNSKLLGEGVAGGMLWFDRRFTKRGSKFNQITAGAEWLGENWDVRANGYMPFNDSKTFTQGNPNGTGAGFVGNQILVNTDQSVVEEALPGVDLEVGRKLDFLDGITDATRIYAGGYHFEGNRVEDVTGVRARIASDITQDIQIGARYQYDDVRDSQTYLEATVRFPFKSKKSFREEGVRSRLDESPERDIDIVNNEAVIDDGINEVILNANTGATQNVVHVDNTAGAGGDGSIETPFNTLAAAEGAAVANDLIYVHRGDGTTTGQDVGITLDDQGQILAGAGADLLFSSGKFTTANNQDITNNIIVATQTTAPVITNGAGNGVDVIADNVLVTGINVDGASVYGILGTNSSDIAVNNTAIINNTNAGIRIESDAGNISQINIADNIVNNNGANGIYARALNGGNIDLINIRNNTTNLNGQRGIFVYTSGGDIDTINIIDNTSEDNVQNGYTAQADGAGNTISSINFTNNIADDNDENGFYVFADNDGDIGTVDFEGNVSTNNTLDGFLARVNGAGSTLDTISVINNNSLNNGEDGFEVISDNGGIVEQTTISANLAENNILNGYQFISINNNSLIQNILFEENISNLNTQDGVEVIAQLTGDIEQGVFQNNILSNNSQYGINIREISALSTFIPDLGGGILGSVGGNSIFNNTLEEVRVDLSGDELKAENNYFGTVTGLLAAEILLIDGSTIDADPFLTSDPN